MPNRSSMCLRSAVPIFLSAIVFTACEGVQDVLVRIPPHVALATSSPLSSIPPTTVDVRTFHQPNGTGVLPGRIGERKTIGDISMGLVTAAPPPEQVMTDAVEAE